MYGDQNRQCTFTGQNNVNSFSQYRNEPNVFRKPSIKQLFDFEGTPDPLKNKKDIGPIKPFSCFSNQPQVSFGALGPGAVWRNEQQPSDRGPQIYQNSIEQLFHSSLNNTKLKIQKLGQYPDLVIIESISGKKESRLKLLKRCFAESPYGPLEVEVSKQGYVLKLKLICNGQCLAEGEGQNRVEAETKAVYSLLSSLQKTNYFIEMKSSYLPKKKFGFPPFVLTPEPSLSHIYKVVCLKSKTRPEFSYPLSGTVPCVSSEEELWEYVTDHARSGSKADLFVLNIDKSLFKKSKLVCEQHSLRWVHLLNCSNTGFVAVSKKSPLEILQDLIECGGESIKYRLIPPGSSEHIIQAEDEASSEEEVDNGIGVPLPTSGESGAAEGVAVVLTKPEKKPRGKRLSGSEKRRRRKAKAATLVVADGSGSKPDGSGGEQNDGIGVLLPVSGESGAAEGVAVVLTKPEKKPPLPVSGESGAAEGVAVVLTKPEKRPRGKRLSGSEKKKRRKAKAAALVAAGGSGSKPDGSVGEQNDGGAQKNDFPQKLQRNTSYKNEASATTAKAEKYTKEEISITPWIAENLILMDVFNHRSELETPREIIFYAVRDSPNLGEFIIEKKRDNLTGVITAEALIDRLPVGRAKGYQEYEVKQKAAQNALDNLRKCCKYIEVKRSYVGAENIFPEFLRDKGPGFHNSFCRVLDSSQVDDQNPQRIIKQLRNFHVEDLFFLVNFSEDQRNSFFEAARGHLLPVRRFGNKFVCVSKRVRPKQVYEELTRQGVVENGKYKLHAPPMRSLSEEKNAHNMQTGPKTKLQNLFDFQDKYSAQRQNIQQSFPSEKNMHSLFDIPASITSGQNRSIAGIEQSHRNETNAAGNVLERPVVDPQRFTSTSRGNQSTEHYKQLPTSQAFSRGYDSQTGSINRRMEQHNDFNMKRKREESWDVDRVSKLTKSNNFQTDYKHGGNYYPTDDQVQFNRNRDYNNFPPGGINSGLTNDRAGTERNFPKPWERNEGASMELSGRNFSRTADESRDCARQFNRESNCNTSEMDYDRRNSGRNDNRNDLFSKPHFMNESQNRNQQPNLQRESLSSFHGGANRDLAPSDRRESGRISRWDKEERYNRNSYERGTREESLGDQRGEEILYERRSSSGMARQNERMYERSRTSNNYHNISTQNREETRTRDVKKNYDQRF